LAGPPVPFRPEAGPADRSKSGDLPRGRSGRRPGRGPWRSRPAHPAPSRTSQPTGSSRGRAGPGGIQFAASRLSFAALTHPRSGAGQDA